VQPRRSPLYQPNGRMKYSAQFLPEEVGIMSNIRLIVFYAQKEGDKIVDIGDDPCFSELPTWGICRPNMRKSCKVGDVLIFIACFKEKPKDDPQRYILKGWFCVGEKIDYITALERFPGRRNVIIAKSEHQQRTPKWRYPKIKKAWKAGNADSEPAFFRDIKSSEGTYYQNSADTHEIDNWKCRRIFHCASKRCEACIKNNACSLDGQSLRQAKFSNYIVAKDGEWYDVDSHQIPFIEIQKKVGFDKDLRTPKGQHNVLKFDSYYDSFCEYMKEKGIGN
jgi:hypothetical protein